MAAGKKLTQEEFITRAKEIHGDKYDYSKIVYKNAVTDICIICPEHGEFWQRAGHHLKGCGCPKCSAVNSGNDRRKTTEDFIARAKEVHGDKYDYSNVVYKNANDKVIIICPEHGEFLCKPSKHLSGRGCPKCAGKYKTTEDFVEQAKKVHGDKYDYSKIEYINCDTKITVVCPKQGEFSINPSRFLNGFGCPKCATDKKWEGKRMTTEEFIMKAKEVHGNKYDYSKTHCGKLGDKVCIICPEHSEFWQLPSYHLKGCGCPKCLGKNMTTEDFVAKLQKLYGDKYDYSKVEYASSNTLVTIICPVHGEFQRKPVNLLNGKGETCCPKCNGTYMDTDYFIEKAREVHGDKYDYSKVVYKTNHDKVCIICPEHGEFWQTPKPHLKGSGCPNCQGLRKEYKFNLLEEFADEFCLRDFLMTNDQNLIYIILRNIEKIGPKFNPIVNDIDRVLRSDSTNPIEDLEDKYRTPDETVTSDTVDREINTTTIDDIDLDDDDAVEAFINNTNTTVEKTEPTIDELTRARENEINLINTIEHILTPEDRQFIKDKFLNDKRRNWMLERDKNV